MQTLFPSNYLCQLEFSQDSPKDKMDFILIELLGNLLISHLSDLVSNIPKWNARVENYVASIFIFANLYFTKDGCVLFFLQWWLPSFGKHKVLFRELQLQNSFEVYSCQQNASDKSWIPHEKGKHFWNSTKAYCVHVGLILTYCPYVIDFPK